MSSIGCSLPPLETTEGWNILNRVSRDVFYTKYNSEHASNNPKIPTYLIFIFFRLCLNDTSQKKATGWTWDTSETPETENTSLSHVWCALRRHRCREATIKYRSKVCPQNKINTSLLAKRKRELLRVWDERRVGGQNADGYVEKPFRVCFTWDTDNTDFLGWNLNIKDLICFWIPCRRWLLIIPTKNGITKRNIARTQLLIP